MDRSAAIDEVRRMAIAGLAANDATGWFERLYGAAAAGEAGVPWDRGAPHGLLVRWAQSRRVAGGGRRALVVGSGLGHDAEYVAGLGFDTTAFDVAATAVRLARERFPASRVDYVAADLLQPPAEWRFAFDLVFESMTLQSLPDSLRAAAIERVASFVAPGGTLLVVASIHAGDGAPDGPPWPLRRTEVEALAAGGRLEPVSIDQVPDPLQPEVKRWLAEFRRPGEDAPS